MTPIFFVEGQTAAEAYSKGNELLNMVQKYMLLNKLHINMSKCCYIHFKPKAPNFDPSNSSCNNLELFINQIPIKKVSETKFLGVTIDEHLSWESHITALRRKLNYASATLYRIRDSLPTHLRKDLYHTLYMNHTYHTAFRFGVDVLFTKLPGYGSPKNNALDYCLVIRRPSLTNFGLQPEPVHLQTNY